MQTRRWFGLYGADCCSAVNDHLTTSQKHWCHYIACCQCENISRTNCAA